MALIDIMPIMTSNTTPSPYVINASDSYSNSFLPYRAFDGHYDPKADAGWVVSTSKNVGEWLSVDFGELKNISMIKIGNYRNNFNQIKKITIMGSIDGVVYDVVIGKNISISYNIDDNEYATCYFGGVFRVRGIRIIIEEVAKPSTYTGIGEIKILLDDTLKNNKEKVNKFKTPISVGGYLELKKTNLVPDAPIAGSVIIFTKDGKLYQIDENGTESEVGSGSSISGKVVTGIESGQDKIVISFSDGTQEEVSVVTDLTEVNKEIQKTKSEVTKLKISSHAGEELDSGEFGISEYFDVTGSGEILPLTVVRSGNIPLNDDYSFRLEKGKKYLIMGKLVSTGDAHTLIYGFYNAKTNENIGTTVRINTPNYSGDSSASSPAMTMYEPVEDTDVVFKVESFKGGSSVKITTSLSVVVTEVGRTYYHNEVKSVDEKEGIQDTPVGHVISHIGLTAPKHYLVCDGKEYNIVDYPKLAEHFLTHFGLYNYFGGNGTTTFAVPDMRGEFVRGYDNESIRDPQGATRGIGKHQEATKSPLIFRGSNGNFNTYDGTKDVMEEDYDSRVGVNEGKNGRKATTSSYDTTVENTHYTARPTNVNVLFCIKYEPTYYMEYHPKYATFKKDLLFDGGITTSGEYDLTGSVDDYDFVIIESNQKHKEYEVVHPPMENENTPSPYVVTASGHHDKFDPYKAFNFINEVNYDSWYKQGQPNGEWIQIYLGKSELVQRIDLSCPTGYGSGSASSMIKNVDIFGSNDGVEWTLIDKILDQKSWKEKETRTFHINNSKLYSYYRLTIVDANRTDQFGIGEITLYKKLGEYDSLTNRVTVDTKYRRVEKSGYDIGFKSDKFEVFDTNTSSINRIVGIKGTSDAFDIPTSDEITSDELTDMIDDIWR